MEFLKEFIEFLKARRKYWLIPILIVLVLFGGIIIPVSLITSGSAPPEDEIKGTPQAIASIAANPKPSYKEGMIASSASQ